MTIVLPDSPCAQAATTKLRILQTTDLHGHVLAYDYHRDAPSLSKGLSRTATLIGTARQSVPLSLLFGSGDFLQGSPMSDRLALNHRQSFGSAGEHPVINAMNLLGYDAVTLGNHDLDFGLDYLKEALTCARFPVVSANLFLPGELGKLVKPYALLKRSLGAPGESLTIGVTGCLPLETLQGGAALLAGVRASPIKPALEGAITAMQQAGADVIVVLAHCGLSTHSAADEAECIRTITPLKGVDAVLGGHTHEVIPNSSQPSPAGQEPAVVMAGAWGMHLGQIDMRLERNAHARWHVASALPAALPVAPVVDNAPLVPECERILEHFAPAHAETRAALRTEIGHTEGRLDSFFSLVRNDAGLQLIAAAFESRMRALLSDTAFENTPILSAAAPYKTGARAGASHYCLIPAGPIAKRDVSSLYGFSDRLCAVRLTGEALRAWLEQSASIFTQVQAHASDQPLLNAAFPGYLFDVIPQLSYEIDLSQPARFSAARKLVSPDAYRIKNLRYRGAAVQDGDVFIAAVNSFRAYGEWPELAAQAAMPKLVFDSGQLCSQVLEQHIAAASPIGKTITPSWRFSPISGASACFFTAPEAREHPVNGIEYLRTTSEGFAEMRLHFP